MPKQKVNIPSRRDAARSAAGIAPAGKRGPKRKMKSGTGFVIAPDYGPPERWQHATRRYEVVDEKHNRLAARVVEECALDALHMQGTISGKQRVAGLQLRRAWLRARLEAPRTGRYEQREYDTQRTFRAFERTPLQEEAYDEWRLALLSAPLHSVDILVSVCCVGNVPAPIHMVRLRDGLDMLVSYYKGDHG
jgi:hypothetical protein